MDLLKQLADISRRGLETLKEEKEKGTKIIGYTGRFVPEELILAAGALPYLLCKGGEPEPPEAALPYALRYLSPFARAQIGYHLLSVDPVMPLLDLIIAQCGDCHMERVADLLEYFGLPTERLGVPSDWEKEISAQYYYRGLTRVKEKLEDITDNEISHERLGESIRAVNRVRGLLEAISSLRKEQPPPIGGYDFIRINHYSFYCRLDELTDKLEALCAGLKQAPKSFSDGAPRILLAGHVIGIGDYVVPKLIEDLGGVIVREFLDEGMRGYGYSVKDEGDLLANLGETYYLERTPPSIFQPAWGKRVESVKRLIKEFSVDGVIWYQLSFEEVYNMESSILAKSMEEMGIPFLKLESSYEYSREAMGPLITRIESFIDSIRTKKE